MLIDETVHVSTDGPARHDKAVCLCVDEAFLPYALFVANQIDTKVHQRDFDIVIASQGELPEHPLFEDLRIRRARFDLGQIEQELFSDTRITLAAYLRIFLPRKLQNDYRRILYLDADVFYQRGDLSRLLDIDMQGKSIAAVRDLPQTRRPMRGSKDVTALDKGYFKYFNSGVMLFDTGQFVEDGHDEKAIEFASDLGARLAMHDQTALNLATEGNWLELNPVWNFIYTHQTMYFSGFFDVCFYHFCGRRKPFRGTYGGFARRFTEPYSRFLGQHFPHALAGVQKGLQVDNKYHLHFGVLLFHAANFRRYMRSEDEWRDDFDAF